MRLVRQQEPNPITGMHDMGFALEPGDRVVLITGEEHRLLTEPISVPPGIRQLEIPLVTKTHRVTSLGWAILDYNGKVIAWSWLDPVTFADYCNCGGSKVTIMIDVCSPDVHSSLN